MKKLILGTITASLLALQTFTSTAEDVLFERDLTGSQNFDFAYGSWEGNMRPSEEGIIVAEQCDYSGGAGFINFSLNLAGIPLNELFVVVEAKRLPSASAKLLGVLLVSKSMSDASCWQYPIADISDMEFTSVEYPLAAQPAYTRDAGVDFSNIIDLQVQGDYTTPGEIGLLIRKIKIIRKN
jgi:hypothetical protein